MQPTTHNTASGSPISVNICRPTLRGVSPDTPAENSWFPLWMLKRHFDLRIDEKPDFLFYGDVGNGEHLLYPSRTIRIFLTGENIAPNWKEADYALTHERLWNDRHWRAPLWRHFYDPGHTRVDRSFTDVRRRVDRFCNFIYSNETASERIEFFEKLNARKPVDSGGRVRNNLGGPVEENPSIRADGSATTSVVRSRTRSPGSAGASSRSPSRTKATRAMPPRRSSSLSSTGAFPSTGEIRRSRRTSIPTVSSTCTAFPILRRS